MSTKKFKFSCITSMFIFLVLGFMCPSVFAYKLLMGQDSAVRWSEGEATYYVNPSGGPSGSLSAIKAAMKTWSNVSTSSFEFVYDGTTESKAYGEDDGSNIVCFGPISTKGLVGENQLWYDDMYNVISDSDIILNTKHKWSTNGSGDSYDVRSVATHELGHSLHLGDLYGSDDTEKTMYAHGAGKIGQRTLHQDDIDGITYLYPSDHISHTGEISVSVYDINDSPITYESLRLKGKKTKTSIITSTDGDGFFKFEWLRADTYIITVSDKDDRGFYSNCCYQNVKRKVILGEGGEEEISVTMEEK